MPGWKQQVVEHVHPSGGVVVGDDASRCGAKAVRYGLEEARRRGTTLHVVLAWSIVNAVRPPDLEHGYVPSLEESEKATRDAEERRVAELVGPEPGVPVEVHVVHHPAVPTLLEASRTADVLVVGTRGRGGFERLLLGSTAEQCVRYAEVPVVVVR